MKNIKQESVQEIINRLANAYDERYMSRADVKEELQKCVENGTIVPKAVDGLFDIICS